MLHFIQQLWIMTVIVREMLYYGHELFARKCALGELILNRAVRLGFSS